MSKELAPNPDYALARAEITDFARYALAISAKNDEPMVTVSSAAMPRVALAHLHRDPEIDELLLTEGASMSVAYPNADYPDLGIRASARNLQSVWLRATQWQQPHATEIELSFDYSQRQKLATQTINAFSSAGQIDGIPTLSRYVWAIDYAESGYEGHKQELLEKPSPEALLAFIGVCRYVFDNR